MNDLYKGAIKSAVSSASALIVSLPMVDNERFAVSNWHGLAHLAEVILWVVIVSEARFWKEWADKANEPKP